MTATFLVSLDKKVWKDVAETAGKKERCARHSRRDEKSRRVFAYYSKR